LFEDVYEQIYKRNPEITLIGIWGRDGLCLEDVKYGYVKVDPELIGAEISDVISKFTDIKFMPNSYNVVFRIDSQILTIYALTHEFFLIVLAHDFVIPGKLNFYVEILKKSIIEKL
jgi:hypothetical protein